MTRLPIPIVQSRSNHGDIELGRQSPPAVHPDISSSASPPPSSSPFLLPGLLSISLAILFLSTIDIEIINVSVSLFIYRVFRLCIKLLTGNRGDLAIVAVFAILVLGVIGFASIRTSLYPTGG
ncbi:hypothetical protein BGX38DRAFT_332497 [Terfezia claveryi]|nr:hypothetical protein BGX38DRAFT_332497 [Terfezia claveryi]